MERAPCPASKRPAVRELRVPDSSGFLPHDFRYIGFPFPDDAELREKARGALPLRAALRSSAMALQAKEASLGAQMLSALDALDRSR